MTFTGHLGTYRYSRMPFGLRNAPVTFQRALEIILSEVRWRTSLVYLDDIVVFSKNTEYHIGLVDHILRLLSNAGVNLKPKKRVVLQQKVQYLSHVISPSLLGVSQDAKGTQSIREATF